MTLSSFRATRFTRWAPLARLVCWLCAACLAGTAPRAGAQTIVNSGSGVLHGTWLFDFDLGSETVGPGADVWWDQETSVVRYMVPSGSATLANLGIVDFASVSYSMLTGTTYCSTPIVGNDDLSNQLVTNDVFAVLTGDSNYAKVLVTTYGYNLQIQWVTYNTTPVPEPPSVAALLATCGLTVAWRRRRRVR